MKRLNMEFKFTLEKYICKHDRGMMTHNGTNYCKGCALPCDYCFVCTGVFTLPELQNRCCAKCAERMELEELGIAVTMETDSEEEEMSDAQMEEELEILESLMKWNFNQKLPPKLAQDIRRARIKKN